MYFEVGAGDLVAEKDRHARRSELNVRHIDADLLLECWVAGFLHGLDARRRQWPEPVVFASGEIGALATSAMRTMVVSGLSIQDVRALDGRDLNALIRFSSEAAGVGYAYADN